MAEVSEACRKQSWNLINILSRLDDMLDNMESRKRYSSVVIKNDVDMIADYWKEYEQAGGVYSEAIGEIMNQIANAHHSLVPETGEASESAQKEAKELLDKAYYNLQYEIAPAVARCACGITQDGDGMSPPPIDMEHVFIVMGTDGKPTGERLQAPGVDKERTHSYLMENVVNATPERQGETLVHERSDKGYKLGYKL